MASLMCNETSEKQTTSKLRNTVIEEYVDYVIYVCYIVYIGKRLLL